MRIAEPIFAGVSMPEKDLDNRSWFSDGDAITSLEGNRLALFKKDEVFFIRTNDGELLAWAELDGHNVKTIYTLPQHRRERNAIILLHAIKEILGKVVFPDVVFPESQAIIAYMASHPNQFELSIELDGVTHAFNDVLIRSKKAKLVIEGKIGDHPLAGLSAPGTPGTGPLQRSSYTWFL